MALKNLLLAYNGSDSSRNALQAAIALQNIHDAHLTGLLAHGPSQLTTNLKPWMPQNIVDSVTEIEDGQYESIKQEFYDLVSDHVAEDKIHWMSRTGEASMTVTDYARLFDLTLVGRYDAVYSEAHLALDPQHIVLNSGRPVMIVPRNFNAADFQLHAVVAWDGKRAAARALYDAISVLEQMQKITIVTIERNSPVICDKDIDISTALRRHGIESHFVHLKREQQHTIEDLLLDYCNTHSPSLLVMGVYEQNRFLRTQNNSLAVSLLQKTAIPIFLSC